MGRWKRAETVAEWFGVDRCAIAHRGVLDDLTTARLRELIPRARQIVLIRGPSGSGKSTLLRRLRRLLGHRCVDLERIEIAPRPVIELFEDMKLEDALALLSKLGLAEAHTYLLPAAKLSAGQQWRLRLALGIAQAQRSGEEPCLVCDEFANPLDRVTATVVAHALRRMIDGMDMSAILATTREDLDRALRPEIRISCDFGAVRVERRE